MLVITMSHIQDIIITHTPTIMGIMAIVITRVLALITVTEIMAAIEAGILLMGGIMDMGGYRRGYENNWHRGYGGYRGGYHGGFHR